MSRLLTTIGMILLILAISFCGIWYVHQSNKEMIALCEDAIIFSNKENQDGLLSCIKKLSALWESKQLILSLYVRHDEMERIDSLLVVINAYYETKNYHSVSVELHQLEFMLDHIYRRELPTINNLL
ncbi:DUF4363 family protein [Paludicola sp. MB14-C6]|uniref:DUF4363 family protein n=1 Tax=Paludihabitans sp. MB14-C6 TaxID=3070656 RepID=UPI0027DE93C2|nr:DUF4363 family protein [Paludicola sp. MB14-C6]WMJ23498.1 DUF4363 family protein [Paludicola sp. MB14-C6]